MGSIRKRITLRFRQKPLFDQCLEVDKIRVTGIRGKRLVRGIAVPGRTQRQDLPDLLSRPLKLIYEFIRFL